MKTYILYSSVLILCFSLANAAVRKDEKDQKRIWEVYAVIGILSVMAGMRGKSVGMDTVTYWSAFLSKGSNASFEKGFVEVTGFLMDIFHSPSFVLLCIGTVTNSIFLLGFWNLRKFIRFDFAVVCYYIMIYFLTYNGMRQFLAIAVVFYFGTRLFQYQVKAFAAYIVSCIAMMTMHQSAFFALFLIPIIYLVAFLIRNNVRFGDFLIVVLFSAFIIVFSPRIYARFSSRYQYTLSMGQAKTGLMVIFRVGILILACISVWNELHDPDCNQEIEQSVALVKKRLLYCTLILDAFYQLICAAAYSFPMVVRAGWYFLPYEAVLYSYILKKKNNIRYFVPACMIMVALGYMLLNMYRKDGNGVIPYKLSFSVFGN